MMSLVRVSPGRCPERMISLASEDIFHLWRLRRLLSTLQVQG